jgi:NAD(P)-dependent dehydrogenase (short-subunit alcohol dehydrogenase family)
MDLTNASAIVTGGAGGFGSATMRSPCARAYRTAWATSAADLAKTTTAGRWSAVPLPTVRELAAGS